jgi:3-oxoacyl-[acyl-carrier-protein] synthase II
VSVATPRGQLTTPDGAPRVVVTGTGMLTALGADVASTWAGLLAGRSGITTITAFDPARVASRIAGEVPGFDPSGVLDRKEQRRTDRFTQLALVAAREALDEAGLPGRLEGELAERTGILIGTGLGGGITFGEQVAISIEKGPDRVSPFFVPMAIPNLAAGQAAIFFGALGPNYAIASACASGGHAVGEAWEIIRRGDAEMMLAGSAEAVVSEPLVAGFGAMRALSTRNDDPAAASRPFDRGRDGFVIGEGAGVLVLETLAHARDRGAQPLGEVVGYGATADASHVTLPAPGGVGAIRAVRRALEKARLTVDDVEHVNAHATSTPEGDRTELEMLRGLFGARAGEVNVTAIKSMIGHTLGAAGSIEAIVTLRTLREGVVPPTINLDDPDELAAGLDLTPNVARERRMSIAVSNSFGFGGQNSALVLRRWDE